MIIAAVEHRGRDEEMKIEVPPQQLRAGGIIEHVLEDCHHDAYALPLLLCERIENVRVGEGSPKKWHASIVFQSVLVVRRNDELNVQSSAVMFTGEYTTQTAITVLWLSKTTASSIGRTNLYRAPPKTMTNRASPSGGAELEPLSRSRYWRMSWSIGAVASGCSSAALASDSNPTIPSGCVHRRTASMYSWRLSDMADGMFV